MKASMAYLMGAPALRGRSFIMLTYVRASHHACCSGAILQFHSRWSDSPSLEPSEVMSAAVPQTVDWLRQHDGVALRVAQEGKEFAARHMTQHGRTCYTHRVLLVRAGGTLDPAIARWFLPFWFLNLLPGTTHTCHTHAL